MRRTDREVTDTVEILDIIARCDVCRLGLSQQNIPYVVPMNFGYTYAEGRLTLYFHAAKEGKKLDIMRDNPVACFEMDGAHRLIEADEACAYTMEYESVIGTGQIRFCEDENEKIEALGYIMKKYAKDRTFHFPNAAIAAVTVFRLEVSEFSGKRARKNI